MTNRFYAERFDFARDLDYDSLLYPNRKILVLNTKCKSLRKVGVLFAVQVDGGSN